MSYPERRTIVMLATGIALMAAYSYYAVTRWQAGAYDPNEIRSWAIVMLVFCAIGAGVTIVTQVIFHIIYSVGIAVKTAVLDGKPTDEAITQSVEVEFNEDEMDKLIELKSGKVTSFVGGTGFLVALVLIAVGLGSVLALNVMFISFFIGNLGEAIAQLIYYRRGIRHA